jgi:hypothetical protein
MRRCCVGEKRQKKDIQLEAAICTCVRMYFSVLCHIEMGISYCQKLEDLDVVIITSLLVP